MEQQSARCYKGNEIGHISSECCKVQNALTETSKGKGAMLAHESRETSNKGNDIDHDGDSEGGVIMEWRLW